MKTERLVISCLLLHIISLISAKMGCEKVTVTGNIIDNITDDYRCFQAHEYEIDDVPDEAQSISFFVTLLHPYQRRPFARFSQLRRLSFYNSEITRNLSSDIFGGLEKLQWLIFYETTIYEIDPLWFEDMPNLTHLFLDRNDIVYIDPHVFLKLPNLIYLNIEDNNLNCLPKGVLKSLTKLKHARIRNNPWLCSCYKELTGWMKSRQINYKETDAMKKGLQCMVEDVPQVRDFTLPMYNTFENISVSGDGYIQITAGQDVRCVGEDISVLSKIPNNVRSIKFINTKISELQQFPFLRFGNSLTSLHFQNCGIRKIDSEAFAGLSKLEVLLLVNNSIGSVRSDWFRDLHNLQYLVLEKNEITMIPDSTFSLLDKLKFWSLSENKLQCIPISAFNSLKQLKEVVLTHNPWYCDCQDNFRRWLHEHRIRYVVSRGPCVNGRIEDSEDLFEQVFEERVVQVNNQTAHVALYPEKTNRDRKELNDEISADEETSENQYVEISSAEAYHNDNINRSNSEHEDYLIEQQRPSNRMYRRKFLEFERTATFDIFPRHIDFFSPHYDLQKLMNYIRVECIYKEIFPAGKPSSYVSYGGTLWDALAVPSDAMAIRFRNSAIPEIFSGIFSRFSNTLRILEFLHCAVQDIEPQAFNELVNLEELTLNDNHIQVIKAAWFEGTPNLRNLSLARNSIFKIDDNVFQVLPNLEVLEISGNKLHCLQFDALSYLTELNTMYIGNNPWSCLCERNLNRWLHKHGIMHDEGALDEKVNQDCHEDNSVSKNNSILDAKFTSETNIDAAEELENIQATQNSKIYEESTTTTEHSKTMETEYEINLNFVTSKVQETVSIPTIAESEQFERRCKFHLIEQHKSRWRCSGGDVSVLDQIPKSAETIEFIDANIPFIPTNAFVQFTNLTSLMFYSSGVRNIDPLAFSTLNKLEWLIFFNNSIPIIRASWFRYLGNLTLLGLVGNSITEIEPDVFNFLPNLQRLSIQNNNLSCLYTKSLASLKYLQRVTMQENPWKWRCHEELIQYFEARDISYLKSGNHVGRCIPFNIRRLNFIPYSSYQPSILYNDRNTCD